MFIGKKGRTEIEEKSAILLLYIIIFFLLLFIKFFFSNNYISKKIDRRIFGKNKRAGNAWVFASV